ncbi:DUF1488 domain-containing protein [Trinickia caryophylli]|nr:DUF1488 domain-containing protein [Trinickia caryophylli]PMS10740.1 DUF1488 domain-containing protein [Trinickia caryophylli]TRX13882.1 DUF1488 domain-containing protein [Trinickia caryophylli]WQE15473.1 DUF1488 domain-containing protein [Trinickia caryophylli]
MDVTFPDDPPMYDGAQLVVRFMAAVDGVPLACAVTLEALEDHFGAQPPLEADILRAYETGKGRIREVCTRALEANGGAAVVLRSGLFRIESA